MQFLTRVGLLAALLAYVQLAQAFTVTVTQISCSYLYFTLVLTPAESGNSQYLGVYQGTSTTNMVSEIQFNAAYASTNTYQWYAPFFTPLTTSGVQQVSFRLLDQNEEPITTYATVTQSINFQCGTTVTTSSAAASSPTSNSGSGSSSGSGSGSNSSGNGSSDANNSSTSSGSSSSTGAIAGGVVGGVIVLALLGLLAFCLMRKKKKQRAQQSRLRNDEADEAAFRAPNNNDSTASLATAPETANTPMMRDIGTKNVFADPTASGVSGAPSGSSTVFTANNMAASKPPSGSSIGAGAGAGAAAAAGGIGAAAIAARKQSREQSREQPRSHSPARASDFSPSTESFKDTPSSQSPPPVPALPAAVAAAPAAPAQSATQNSAPTSQPASQDSTPASYPKSSNGNGAAAGTATAVGTGAAGAAAAAAAAKSSSDSNKDKDSKAKTSKWGFKRASKDMGNSSRPPYPQAVAEPAASSAPAPAPAPAPAAAPVPAPVTKSTPSPPASNSPEMPASPSRSFKVIQKQPSPALNSTAGPSNNSFYGGRSGPATPAGSIRGNNYSRAPSVASMSAGFAEAPPPLPSGAASVSSAPVSEFGGNMAGIGAGRSFAASASSGNSTKWHQQSYNIMPNFSHRALARSTQLDEDLIFGNLGMGLNGPAPGAGGASETASGKARGDPFGDR